MTPWPPCTQEKQRKRSLVFEPSPKPAFLVLETARYLSFCLDENHNSRYFAAAAPLLCSILVSGACARTRLEYAGGLSFYFQSRPVRGGGFAKGSLAAAQGSMAFRV